MVKFNFSHLKLRRQPFVAEIFKIQGGLGVLPPFRTHNHIYVRHVNFWELIIAFPNGDQWAPFSKIWLKPLVTPLHIRLSSSNNVNIVEWLYSSVCSCSAIVRCFCSHHFLWKLHL